MAAPKRTRGQRERDLAEIARLVAEDKTGREIANILNAGPDREYDLTEQTITRDIRALFKRWRKDQQQPIEDLIAVELNQLKQARREAWEAWAASWNSRHGPDPRFLEMVGKSSDRIIKLLGLTEPIKVEVNWRREARDKLPGITPQRLFEGLVDRYIELHEESTGPALLGSGESSEAEDPPKDTAPGVDTEV